MRNKDNAKRATIAWVRKNDPNVYALAVKRHALKQGHSNIYGLSAIEEDTIASLSGVGDFFSTLSDTVVKVLPKVIDARTTDKVLKAQLKRGEMGLPPLDVADYAPVLKVQPEFNPQTEAAYTRIATQSIGSSLGNVLPWIGLGGLALIMIMRR